MKIGAAPPIRKPLPLVPMVDVVFLLLMFFMLSSTFLKLGSFDFSNGGTGSASAAAPGVIIKVGAHHVALVNGQTVTLANLPAVLDEFVARGAKRAQLTAAAGADVQDLVDALAGVRRSRMTDVVVGW